MARRSTDLAIVGVLAMACHAGGGSGGDAASNAGTGSPATTSPTSATRGTTSDSSGSGTTDRPDLPPGDPIGSFQLGYYWVTAEGDYDGAKTWTLFDPQCGALATVDPGFADALALEGTGRLDDGRLLNVDGPCGCAHSPCYVEADAGHPWGYGTGGRALVPLRSIAVDPALVKIGTGLYLEELDGVVMPAAPPLGGFVHDGCVVADDVGSDIVGMHVDLFTGLRSYYMELDAKLELGSVTVHAGGERCSG